MPTLPPVVDRLFRYVKIDTQSDPESQTIPSTEKQKDLSRLLVQELHDLGLEDAFMDEYGYVFATLPATITAAEAGKMPAIALLAHVDTSPDASGADIVPVIHSDYDGSIIRLPGDDSVILDPAERPALLHHIGHDIITSDGKTLLGSDDKAGVAVLMQLIEDCIKDTKSPRPSIRICFTIDEEIGRGVDHLDLKILGADVAYTIDGSGTNTISVETFNAAEAILEVKGVMVHPGYAKGVMVNAVRILSEMVAMLPPGEAPETTSEREGYIHPHNFSEGDATAAKVKILLRDFTAEGLQRRKDYLQTLAILFQNKYPRAGISLEIKDQYKNMRTYIEDKDDRVISFAHETANQLGIELDEEVVRGGTDGSRLSEMGIPTPNIFNGGHDYHSCFEWNSVQNLEASLFYLKALVHYWGEHGSS